MKNMSYLPTKTSRMKISLMSSVWEYLKYEIREISKKISEEAVHSNKIESSALEAKH